MSALDPRIEAVRAKYDLSRDDFWQIPQNKAWVCKHAALEVVATKANIEWSLPQIIEASTADGIAVLAVSGKMGERIEWSTGEASPKNNKNSYPWAMAEKRAKDRVVLKLAGIHGLVYSEDEMPNAAADDDRPLNLPKPKSSASLKRDGVWEEMDREIAECGTTVKLTALRKVWAAKAKTDNWSQAWRDQAAEAFDKAHAELRKIEEQEAGEFLGGGPSVTGNTYLDNFMAG